MNDSRASLALDQIEALDAARDLIAAGVPLFIAQPCSLGCWAHTAGTGSGNSGFDFPSGWEGSTPDLGAVEKWRPGDALGAVMGHGIDLVDVDPRNGGDATLDGMKAAGVLPYVYAEASTPSGGRHLFVASMGVRSHDAVRPGVDVKAGNATGGRGFAFIAPTVKISKTTGLPTPYVWTQRLDVEGFAIEARDDATGLALAAAVDAVRARSGARPIPRQRTASDDPFGDPMASAIGWQTAVDNCMRAIREFAELDPERDSAFNARLNAAAMVLGHYEGAGVISYEQARDALLQAAGRNGSLHKIGNAHYVPMGRQSALRTIDSGWSAGIADPNRVRPREPSTRAVADGSDDAEDGTDVVAAELPGVAANSEIVAPVAQWLPADVGAILNGHYVIEETTLVPREDGAHMFYRGRVHSLHGESESGKSMLAQIGVAITLNAGGTGMYIDFESDAASVVHRLLDMGVDRNAIRERFVYIRPDISPYADTEREAYASLLSRQVDLCVVDGVTEGMGVFGVESSQNNDQVARWIRVFPRRLATSTGAAVVLIDHVTKSIDGRGRFAIGAQAKMAGLDGVAYTVEVRKPIGRGIAGALGVRLAKDRVGFLRPKCGAYRASDRTQEYAYVVIDSSQPDGRIRWQIREPLAAVDPGHALMQAVSIFLEGRTVGMPSNAIEAGVTGRARDIRIACNALAVGGHIKIEVGARNASLHYSLNPYRIAPNAIEDDASDEED